jgi:hypothetical protein
MKLVSVLARGGVDDDCSISTIAVNLSHAEAMPLQPSSGLRSTQIHIQPVTFDVHDHTHPCVADMLQKKKKCPIRLPLLDPLERME